jgi:hypothetical protein
MIQNPFASGISNEDVDLLVNEVMKDPDINLKLIPDVLEKQIYRSTITIVLNAIYKILGEQHGRDLPAGHCLKLGRRTSSVYRKRIKSYYLESIRDDNFDYETLELVADRMLANPAINLPSLPDGVEKQLYVSCLKLVFRLLGMVAASMRISLCGHEIGLHITKAAALAVQQSALQSAANTMTTIDTERIEEFAREAAAINDVSKKWFFGKQRQDFLIQLHASLYGLILGLLDDVLFNTKLELLSDRVRMDVIPTDDKEMHAYRSQFGFAGMPGEQNKKGGIITTNNNDDGEEEDGEDTAVAVETATTTTTTTISRILPMVSSFAIGVGAGLSIMVSLQNGDLESLSSRIRDRKKDIAAIFQNKFQNKNGESDKIRETS